MAQAENKVGVCLYIVGVSKRGDKQALYCSCMTYVLVFNEEKLQEREEFVNSLTRFFPTAV